MARPRRSGSFNGSIIGDMEEWKRTQDVRNIRELFKGRLTDDETARLCRYFEWDRDRTVAAILDCGPGELNELIGSLVRPENPNVDAEARIAFVTRDNVLSDLARRNEISNSVRQYTCDGCDKMWWRRVSNRKSVTRCFRCKRKKQPIPTDQEWGWGEFECQCGHTFAGWARMGMTTSMCHACQDMVSPARIKPPKRRGDGDGGNRRRGDGDGGNRRGRRDNHSCSASNCFNRRGNGSPDQVCMHPRAHPANVQVPSQSHVSTGSTVNTFFDQDDIEPPYQPSLCGIPEVGDEPPRTP